MIINQRCPRTTRVIGGRCAYYFNKRYGRTGTVWEGRHKSSLVQSDQHFLTCSRYIELNPVVAGMVDKPEQYKWSSYLVNACGGVSDLTLHDEYFKHGRESKVRCYAYRELFKDKLSEYDIHLIENVLVSGVFMKYIAMVPVLFLLASWIPVSAQGPGRQADTLYQISTLDALLAGDYDGRIDFRRLKRHGNFGLGTFDALDGEMVAVDGVFYQVRVDGMATWVSLDQLTPFAAVTYFRADDSFRVRGATSCSELHELLLRRFPSDELLYAIKVTGQFHCIKNAQRACIGKTLPTTG